MRKSNSLLPAFLLVFLALPRFVEAGPGYPQADDSNWTFTYLKATAGNRESLRDFVEKNWFAMDAIAVERGLFKSYRLIENITEADTPGGPEWDFIVAVEYFGDQTYSDIRQAFEEIRSRHETVLVEGKSLRDLGRIVRSERVVIH